MALLLKKSSKKVKASTLVEILVASVLIIVVFAIASLSLNNLIKNKVKRNTFTIEQELNRIQYLYQHQKLKYNYTEEFKNWQIEIRTQKLNSSMQTVLEATQKENKKMITRKLQDAKVE